MYFCQLEVKVLRKWRQMRRVVVKIPRLEICLGDQEDLEWKEEWGRRKEKGAIFVLMDQVKLKVFSF
jgi:hypothetical protein